MCWQIAEEREARRVRAARLLLAGQSADQGGEDAFEGLTPQVSKFFNVVGPLIFTTPTLLLLLFYYKP